MQKRFSILIVSAVIAGLVSSLIGLTLVSQAAPEPPAARKIVIFNEETFANKPTRDALVKNSGGEKIKDLPLINGMAVLLSSKVEKALAKQAGVLRIDNDDVVFALGKPACNYDGICEPESGENPSCSDCKKNGEEEPTPPPEGPPQEIAWGVDRIDADLVWDINTGQGVRVAIIDSGIDLDHPDLMENIKGGYNAINSRKSWNDDNGHGTHVAGIVAARNNIVGVVGVAPEAYLYAVKVLNRRGIGFASDIIDGLDWCLKNGIQVANMSIGSSGCSQSYHDAIIRAYEGGITIAAAAGNNGQTDGKIVCPAIWPETIAVSATNIDNGLAYFSSYGPEVNLAAPGQDINSTWNDGYYKKGSGTSMATPHVVGTAALVLADPDLKCDLDENLKCSPAEVQERLENTAEWLLGLTSDEQGFGLVDAEMAVSQ